MCIHIHASFTRFNNWYSCFGTGAMPYGIESMPDQRVVFTVWLSVFWAPVVPISSWSAVYAGESSSIHEEHHRLTGLIRLRHDWGRIRRTFLRCWLIVLAAISPNAALIARTEGRAATPFEIVLVFASIFWMLWIIFRVEKTRLLRLRHGNMDAPKIFL